MAAHVCTGLAGKVHSSALEVLRTSPLDSSVSIIMMKLKVKMTYPPSRYPRANTSQPIRIIQQRRVHLGLDIPRRNRIDRDTARRPLVGEALCELAYGALGRRIGRHCQAALEGQKRRKVDDGAAPAGHGRRVQLEHVRAYVAADGEDAVEVDLDDLFSVNTPEGFVSLWDRARRGLPG